jgi:hypothetical protein
VLVPAPESRGQPLAHVEGNPYPFPDVFKSSGDASRAGLPITLYFPSAEVDKVEAELTLGRAHVGILVATPKKPAVPGMEGNAGAILILPREHLEPRSRYTVRVRYTFRGEPGERAWWFETGKR